MKHKFINILTPETEIEINADFQKAIDLALDSYQNLFITGKAGTGKSTLLNLIRIQTKKNVTTLAPTGLAALNIQGQTIHSFFRFSPQVTLTEAMEVGRKRQKDKVMQNLHMIIIDEISMVRADLLDCIDVCLKQVRGSNLPFGGVQMVFIGDLYQLPPVLRSQDQSDFSQMYESPYFFAAKVMQEQIEGNLFGASSRLEMIELQKIYRQNDADFIELLNAVRRGEKHSTILDQLNLRVTPQIDDQKSIILTTTNQAADDINRTNLDAIKDDFEVYKSTVEGNFNTRDAPTSTELELKPGARVMFVKNDQKGRWVNGTLGVVKELFDDGVEVVSDDGQILQVYPEKWEIYKTTFNQEQKSLENESVGSFTQLPLKLAWAITIHKSQGQTFDKVVLDLKHRAFSAGQTYVALSRCRTLEGLYLTTKVIASDIRTDFAVTRFLEHFEKILEGEDTSAI
jgi:ATP-dependent exoDNAse (exonuclease V) alpha subunit